MKILLPHQFCKLQDSQQKEFRNFGETSTPTTIMNSTRQHGVLLPHEFFQKSRNQQQNDDLEKQKEEAEACSSTKVNALDCNIMKPHEFFESSRNQQQNTVKKQEEEAEACSSPKVTASDDNIKMPHEFLQKSRHQQQNKLGKQDDVDVDDDDDNDDDDDDAFSIAKATDFDCNICFRQAKEAVVTCCGHLYCWPCLYPWVDCVDRCPVCFGVINSDLVFPIIGAPRNRDISRRLQGRKFDPMACC